MHGVGGLFNLDDLGSRRARQCRAREVGMPRAVARSRTSGPTAPHPRKRHPLEVLMTASTGWVSLCAGALRPGPTPRRHPYATSSTSTPCCATPRANSDGSVAATSVSSRSQPMSSKAIARQPRIASSRSASPECQEPRWRSSKAVHESNPTTARGRNAGSRGRRRAPARGGPRAEALERYRSVSP